MIPDPRTGRWLRVAAVVAFLACVILACTRRDDAGSGAAASPGASPRRIVTIGGPVTEIVFALGAGNEVVAVDTSSVFPAAATSALPKVGYQRLLSAEGILAQSPDLILASDEAGPPAALDQLRAAGVTVVLVKSATTIDDAATRIETVGQALGRPAAALAARVRTDAAAAASQAAGGPRFMVVYARGGGTMMVAGTGTTAAAMAQLAGGTNAFTEFSGYKAVSPEAMIAAAPDVIVIPSRGLESMGGEVALLDAPGVGATPAGRAKRIIAMDDLLLLGFGPRLADGIGWLARELDAAPVTARTGT